MYYNSSAHWGLKWDMRIVDAFIGEYASGKSENAINRALELLRQNRQVTIVDLDTVEPFYTLRPLKKKLEQLGLRVIAWDPAETTGLGEAGSLINQQMIWALRNEGDIILDIGYGAHGARILNLVEGAQDDPDLRLLVVVNIARPMTASVEDIVQYVQGLGTVHGLINNSHLGNETTLDIIQDGAVMVTEAARILQLPVIYTAVAREFAHLIGPHDKAGNPVKIIELFMHEAYW